MCGWDELTDSDPAVAWKHRAIIGGVIVVLVLTAVLLVLSALSTIGPQEVIPPPVATAELDDN